MFLLNLVPFWYRWAAIGILIVAVWGHGYVNGGEAAEEKLEATKASIQAERDREALRSAQKVIHDKEVLSETVSDFHSNIAAINAYWLRQPKTSAGMSSHPAVAERTPPGCANAESAERDAEVTRLKYECAVTTAMFNACRDGWIKQE